MDSSKRKWNIKLITIKEWFIRCTCENEGRSIILKLLSLRFVN